MQPNITELLFAWRGGDRDAFDQLFVIVYEELRSSAHSALRRANGDEMLQTTALVNEAYVRLSNNSHQDWKDRAHFFAIAATVMRNVVVDYLRKNTAAKRGGNLKRVELEENPHPHLPLDTSLLELDDVLKRLETEDERKLRVVEMRLFVGMKNHEIAEALNCSLATVKREWTFARAWLIREMHLG